MAIKMSISFKTSSKMTSIKHNNRELEKDDYLKKAHKHINHNLSDMNIYVVKGNLKETYKLLFDDFVDEYNSRQTRNDRKIKDYYHHVKKSKTLDLQREFIITVGKKEDYDNLTPESKLVMADFLKDYINDFIQRNQNLYVYNAVVHVDEIGAPHAHINVIPIAKGYKKGLKVQPSFRKALENQGITVKGRKQLSEFRNREIDIIESKLKKYNVERKRVGTFDIKDMYEYKKIMSLIDEKKKEVEFYNKVIHQQEVSIYEKGKNLEDMEKKLKNLTDLYSDKQEKLSNFEKYNEILASERQILKNDINVLQNDLDIISSKLDAYMDELKNNLPNDNIKNDIEFTKELGYPNFDSIVLDNINLTKQNKKYKEFFNDIKSITDNFGIFNAVDKLKQIFKLVKNFVLPTITQDDKQKYLKHKQTFINKNLGFKDNLVKRIYELQQKANEINKNRENFKNYNRDNDEPKMEL